MTTDVVQEGTEPMIMSSSPGTLDENDSHIMSTENGSQLPKSATAMRAYVLDDILAERNRQDAKWGQQNHPDGTYACYVIAANHAKALTDAHARAGLLTWRDILDEEAQEAFAETDQVLLRAELVQVAAVATAWVECIDRRTS